MRTLNVQMSGDQALREARAAAGAPALAALDTIPVLSWAALHARAIEPSGYYDPAWALAAEQHIPRCGGALALLAWQPGQKGRLAGLLPVRWASSSLGLPVPMLVSWNAYAPLMLPPLDRDCAAEAAGALIDAARESGARALLLRDSATDGAAFAAIRSALRERGLPLHVLRAFKRAALDARQDGEAALRAALGAKKLKELRRQRHRLEDQGPVTVEIARTPAEVAAALDRFLVLERSGWKGRRGTALAQHAGDTAFIRSASAALAAQGRFEIVSLVRANMAIASGLLLRDRDRAYFFKIAIDDGLVRASPGVQLTLDITRHLCADPNVSFADSTADGGHPMIDRVWRERIGIADVFIPLRPRDPLAAAIRHLLTARYAAVEGYRRLRRLSGFEPGRGARNSVISA